MGYQALLFCADERLARVVTQVFTELEFNVELVNEPFSAVKKLMAQRYDAVVVDCENEQNASLIFKSGRNSAGNQNSLALALVEGQAGVAKAYRIGANLVLTKPINVEQAKGTLRVARGLLRKSADMASVNTQSAPPVAPSSAPPAIPASESAFAAQSVQQAAFAAQSANTAPPAASLPQPAFASAPPTPEFGSPSAMPSSATESAAASSEEAKPEISVAKPSPAKADPLPVVSKPAPVPVPSVQERKPAVTFTNLQGAAAAPAPAKEATIAKAKADAAEVFETSSTKAYAPEVIGAPTFSALGEQPSEGFAGGKKFLAIAAIAVVAFGMGYFAWTKFEGKSAAPQTQNVTQSVQPAATSAAAQPASSPVVNQATTPGQSNAVPAPQASKPAAGASTAVTKIAVGSDDTKPEVTTRNFEPAPIHVKTQSAVPKPQKQADENSSPIPDPLGVGSSKDTNLASLVSAPTRLPAVPVSTLRISQGVSQGLLIKKVQPTYPQNAKAMRLEGPVDMEAVIDKEGKITNLKVLKGQPVLAKAATDAVRQWRYKPYYLDGQPVEIQTQITIVFKLPK